MIIVLQEGHENGMKVVMKFEIIIVWKKENYFEQSIGVRNLR